MVTVKVIIFLFSQTLEFDTINKYGFLILLFCKLNLLAYIDYLK